MTPPSGLSPLRQNSMNFAGVRKAEAVRARIFEVAVAIGESLLIVGLVARRTRKRQPPSGGSDQHHPSGRRAIDLRLLNNVQVIVCGASLVNKVAGLNGDVTRRNRPKGASQSCRGPPLSPPPRRSFAHRPEQRVKAFAGAALG